jgi:hypothetical protein
MSARLTAKTQQPWNKRLLVGQKKPIEPKHVWSIRIRLELEARSAISQIFNMAIDSKLRACDLVKLRMDDVYSGTTVRNRATIIQKKTRRPVHLNHGAITEFPCSLFTNGASY